ncbi:hypothetical protein ANN_02933 [Periplaneta americana]|uniref:Uncharacterized protein n=1 Tax=Periplaneta americana TaxID=6978 RepID=A0ABQ8U057_PERAM|nr:hypothetical protein ANN_02933 [Periplaneta americana]
MAGLCEGGNEPSGSLKAICKEKAESDALAGLKVIEISPATSKFKVCHGSPYAVMWLVDEPREFNLPTLPQRCITYVPEKLPRKYGVHSEQYLPIRMVTPVVYKDVSDVNRFKELACLPWSNAEVEWEQKHYGQF